MPKAMRSCICAAISLTALLATGCAGSMPEPAPVAQLDAPVVQPEPCVAAETTSLQRYQELSQKYETEKSGSAALVAELGQEKTARQKAETENESLRSQLAQLTAKAAELDALKIKFDEMQKTCLETANSLRETKQQLIEERLAGVKREETIVALKIERAKDARKAPVERTLPHTEEKPAPDAATSKPISQSTPVSGGNAVVNP